MGFQLPNPPSSGGGISTEDSLLNNDLYITTYGNGSVDGPSLFNAFNVVELPTYSTATPAQYINRFAGRSSGADTRFGTTISSGFFLQSAPAGSAGGFSMDFVFGMTRLGANCSFAAGVNVTAVTTNPYIGTATQGAFVAGFNGASANWIIGHKNNIPASVVWTTFDTGVAKPSTPNANALFRGMITAAADGSWNYKLYQQTDFATVVLIADYTSSANVPDNTQSFGWCASGFQTGGAASDSSAFVSYFRYRRLGLPILTT